MKHLVVLLLFLSCGLFAASLSIIRPPPLPPKPAPRIYLPGIVISANSFTSGKRYCYCFTFKCKVPGMYNGLKGWIINNSKGYFVANGKLYVIHRCDVRLGLYKG